MELTDRDRHTLVASCQDLRDEVIRITAAAKADNPFGSFNLTHAHSRAVDAIDALTFAVEGSLVWDEVPA